MGGRTLLVAMFLVGSSSIALAQVPGDYNGDEGYGAPGMVQPQAQPVLVVTNPCQCLDVMQNRWAVGLSAGSISTTPKGGDYATAYNVGELSLRFRATPHFELELAVAGGEDDQQTGQQISTVALDARYRFAAYSHWNWWLMGGLGALTMAYDGASKDTLDANQRPMVQLGIGLEHRWSQFALQAELRLGSVGPAKNGQMAVPVAADGGSISTPPAQSSSDDTYTAGSFTIGAGYYF
ncbi:MAG: outer membrane beta-barrel protein [Kofleriaceae bacterium]